MSQHGRHYYNEFDARAAGWLRELMKVGLIPEGDVDERSICDVKPNELSGYTQCHFFAGIGGWPLALRLAGWPAGRRVWTGSCPCQPFSTAGDGKGQEDERHLWPVWFELIRECGPELVFGEQVAAAIGFGWLDGVSADLESEGYACGAAVLGAHSVGGPHIRQRLYWVANSQGLGRHGAPGATQQGGRSLAENGCDAGGLADADGGNGSAQRKQRGGKLGLLTQGGSDGGVEHAEGLRLSGGQNHDDGGRRECAPGSGGETGWMGEPIQPGLEGFARDGDDGDQSGRVVAAAGGSVAAAGCAGAWSDFELIPCADGKARRIESGTFPLAHGVPGRVGLLRGYGNAIVPQVAAAFIRAFEEARGGV